MASGHLYKKLIGAVKSYNDGYVHNQEAYRSDIIERVCSTYRLNKDDASRALKELEAGGKIKKNNQRKITLL